MIVFEYIDCDLGCVEMWNDINFVVFIVYEMVVGFSYDEYLFWII